LIESSCYFATVCCFFFVFFFSSRRRHTRWPRDWSSDVCSSDLWIELDVPRRRLQVMIDDAEMMKRKRAWRAPARRFERGYGALRSEERRVGKECRSRGGRGQ